MKKSEFKRRMKKENKAFKSYAVYEMVLIILLVMILIPNLILTMQNMIPISNMWLGVLFALVIAIPVIIIDLKNDREIKNMYQSYLKENKILEYKDKTKALKIMIVVSIVIVILYAALTIPNISKTEDLSEIENTLTITSNEGNTIETKYENFGGFKIKIPTEFNIMSDEAIRMKYPNENPPSLVYTNKTGTINVTLVLDDVAMSNTQIEEYIKTMEAATKEYATDVEVDFWERSNHNIGEIEFVTQAVDTEIYNHIIAFSVDDRLRLVNVNCTKDFMNEWQEISGFILNSIMFE